jgi:putative phosphoesterase
VSSILLRKQISYAYFSIFAAKPNTRNMKIALFSDIHANLPALESFFEHIKIEKPDAIYCLGDLVGYNVWPNEVVNEIRKRGIATLSGNHDAVVGQPTEKISGSFTNNLLHDDVKDYLLALPEHIRLEHKIQGKNSDILFVHGSNRRNNEYLLEEMEEAYLLELLEEANADIMCCAHTHKPFHRAIKSGKGFKHVINIGSLGKPKDGDPRGCYAMLEIDSGSNLISEKGFSVEFMRVSYDVEKAAIAVEKSELPNAFANALRIAK